MKRPSPPVKPLSGTARVPQAELVQVFGHFSAGRYAEMEAAARALCARFASDGQAWKALGIALLVQRKDALAALDKAMALLPGDAEVPSNLGGLLAGRGQWDEAAAHYRRALAIKPDFAQAHSNLADVLAHQSHWAEAEAAAREALRLQPGLAAAHLNLGNALRGQGRWAEAAASYRLAASAQPGLVEAHRNLGLALHRLGDGPAAAASLGQALALRPEHAESHFYLANVRVDLGEVEAALAGFERALQLKPNLAEARTNLGLALGTLGRHDEAVVALQAALQQRPGDALALSNLGNALLAQGRLLDALACQQRAVATAPTLASAQGNLGHALKAIGHPAAALAALQRALALEPESPLRHSELLFTQQYLAPDAAAGTDLAQRLRLVRDFADAARRPAQPRQAWPNLRQFDKTLRIGLLSADLRQHPVGYFSESVFAALADPAQPTAGRLSLHAYANHAGDDALSARLRRYCQTWRVVVGLDDAALAGQIQADGIDILLDLGGHTLGNRLPVLAWRPAPVQVSWLGYCASTGLAEVDAFIADPWIAPVGVESEFVEPLLRLPETFLCFTPPDAAPEPGPLPASRNGGIRFGCFNHLAKLNDAVLALWSRILLARPDSALVLQCAPLADAGVAQQVADRFAAHGIGGERLQLQPAQSRADYLAAIAQVDIVLDPFPYPGGTTTLEALWMGVPVLTLPGSTPLSRQGLSILRNLGLPDWVAADEADYLARALRHAGDLATLAALRQSLRQRLLASPLCDAPRFARHFEAALRGLWQTRGLQAPLMAWKGA